MVSLVTGTNVTPTRRQATRVGGSDRASLVQIEPSRTVSAGPASTPTIVAAAASVAIAIIAWAAGAGSTAEYSQAAVIGWVIGALLVPLTFAWFRSTDLEARSNIRYVEPAWRPLRTVTIAAVIGWVASLGNAWLIASSLARL